MNESWRDILGWEGYYQISNLGAVRSLDRWVSQKGKSRLYEGRELKQKTEKSGYKTVTFRTQFKKKTVKIHRLVAIAFIENPEGKPEVNHIDGVKENNHLVNLEWVTSSENKHHAIQKGLKVNHKGRKAHAWKGEITVLDKEGNVVDTIHQFNEIKEKGYTPCGISAVINGSLQTHRKMKFERRK